METFFASLHQLAVANAKLREKNAANEAEQTFQWYVSKIDSFIVSVLTLKSCVTHLAPLMLPRLLKLIWKIGLMILLLFGIGGEVIFTSVLGKLIYVHQRAQII